MQPIRYWCVTVRRRGESRTVPVYCTSRRVAETVALNLPRHLEATQEGTPCKTTVRVAEAKRPFDSSWPVWQQVTSNRMVNGLRQLAFGL